MRITFIVATASLLSGVLAMWWCASQVAYIAFFFPLVTAPAVVVQRIRIQWLPSEFEQYVMIADEEAKESKNFSHIFLLFD